MRSGRQEGRFCSLSEYPEREIECGEQVGCLAGRAGPRDPPQDQAQIEGSGVDQHTFGDVVPPAPGERAAFHRYCTSGRSCLLPTPRAVSSAPWQPWCSAASDSHTRFKMFSRLYPRAVNRFCGGSVRRRRSMLPLRRGSCLHADRAANPVVRTMTSTTGALRRTAASVINHVTAIARDSVTGRPWGMRPKTGTGE